MEIWKTQYGVALEAMKKAKVQTLACTENLPHQPELGFMEKRPFMEYMESAVRQTVTAYMENQPPVPVMASTGMLRRLEFMA